MRFTAKVYKGRKLLATPSVALNNWEKARGLMFSTQKDVLFVFDEERTLNFHMLFVFYPIDIIFLNNRLQVVDLKERFLPFTCYYSKAHSSHALEVHAGFIQENKIKHGDTLDIRDIRSVDGKPADLHLKIVYDTPKKKPRKRAVKAARKKTAARG